MFMVTQTIIVRVDVQKEHQLMHVQVEIHLYSNVLLTLHYFTILLYYEYHTSSIVLIIYTRLIIHFLFYLRMSGFET